MYFRIVLCTRHPEEEYRQRSTGAGARVGKDKDKYENV